MHPITEVANPQDGLILLLHSGTLHIEPEDQALDLVRAITDEQQHQVLGGATREAVAIEQRNRDLEPTGTAVDFRTAAALCRRTHYESPQGSRRGRETGMEGLEVLAEGLT